MPRTRCYNGELSDNIPSWIANAGQWFLCSGIQDPSGGVARYYRSDTRQCARVSTEITGYAASTLTYLHSLTGDERYLEAATSAARFLCDQAWDATSATFPFEPPGDGQPGFAYFFDCGIILRGLLAVWRATSDAAFLERAKDTALSMAFDFLGDTVFHPILQLPEKRPLPYEVRWARSPGCYQLKSALAWHDLAEATGETKLRVPYEKVVSYALANQAAFLPGEENLERVMDRLHAYCYFLEGLLPVANQRECARAIADGIGRVSEYLRQIAPVFERSDVYAQLLRLRLFADKLGVVCLDKECAAEEARAAFSFQATGTDPRTAAGFYFGRKGATMLPFLNPVSTAFCLQALAMWEGRDASVLI